MASVKNGLLAATCALGLLCAYNVGTARADVSTLPVAMQLTLRQAASVGPNALTQAVHDLVLKTPSQAQSIVDYAYNLNPTATTQMVDSANNALEKRRVMARRAQPEGSSVVGGTGGMTTTDWVIGGVLATGVAGGVAVAAMGGGSDGDTPPTLTESEYFANVGLRLVRADDANARGATGAGVLVGVVDSGIDLTHAEFAGRIDPDSINLITGRPAGNVQANPIDIHGTHVAGIIAAAKDNAGMRGVAYDADLLVLRVFETVDSTHDYTGSSADFGAAYTYGITQGVDVFNGSYTGALSVAAGEPLFDRIADAVAADKVVVFATGNYSMANPLFPALLPYVTPAHDANGLYADNTNAKDYSSLASHLIAVTATDEVGVIADYANRCGVAAAWCIAAPGSGIYSTVPTQTYASIDGTSMATPHVTGAVAALMDLFPSLTPAQIVQRIFTTATKAGQYSDTTIYGNGFLNLNAASSMISSAMLTTGASLSAPQTYNLADVQLSLTPAFGDALSRGLEGQKVMLMDSFDGALFTGRSASELVGSTAVRHADETLTRFGVMPSEKVLSDDGSMSLSLRSVAATSTSQAKTESRLVKSFGSTGTVEIGYMEDPSLGFGQMASGHAVAGETQASGAFMTPYLGFASDGTSVASSTQIGKLTVRAGSFTGHAEDQRDHGAFGALTEVSYAPTARSSIGVQTGFVREENTFLGSETSAAFKTDATDTVYVGFNGHVDLTDSLSLVGSYTRGLSSASGAQGSLLTDLSGVQSDAFSLGLMQANAALQGDRLGLIVNQPLRVDAGQANFVLPVQLDSTTGSLGYTPTTANLSPSGREIDLEAFYALPLGENTHINTSLMYRNEPNHVADASPAFQGLVRIQTKY